MPNGEALLVFVVGMHCPAGSSMSRGCAGVMGEGVWSLAVVGCLVFVKWHPHEARIQGWRVFQLSTVLSLGIRSLYFTPRDNQRKLGYSFKWFCSIYRFLFILLGPKGKAKSYHEIGRAIATLMSDEVGLAMNTHRLYCVLMLTLKLWYPNVYLVLIQVKGCIHEISFLPFTLWGWNVSLHSMIFSVNNMNLDENTYEDGLILLKLGGGTVEPRGRCALCWGPRSARPVRELMLHCPHILLITCNSSPELLEWSGCAIFFDWRTNTWISCYVFWVRASNIEPHMWHHSSLPGETLHALAGVFHTSMPCPFPSLFRSFMTLRIRLRTDKTCWLVLMSSWTRWLYFLQESGTRLSG